MIFSIKYKTDCLNLLDVEFLEGSLNGKYYLDEDSVIILLDGHGNIQDECDLVNLEFEKTTDSSTEAKFYAEPHGEEYAYFLNEKNELIPLEIEFFDTAVSWGEDFTEKENATNCVSLSKIQIDSINNGEINLRLLGFSSHKNVFAAGFKIYIIDLNGGEGEGFYTLGVLKMQKGCLDDTHLGSFEKNIFIKEGGRYCLIITPVAYTTKNSRLGQKQLFLIVDGIITPM